MESATCSRVIAGLDWVKANHIKPAMVNITALGPWETFTLLDLNGGALLQNDPIALRSITGHYVVAENGGGNVVNANRTAIGPWETFQLQFL